MTDETKKTGIRWSRVVLVGSLALNIVILGIVGGAALRWDEGRDRAREVQVRDMSFGPFMGAFNPEQRRDLGRAFARNAGDARAARQEAQALFEEMLDVLRTEPFDQSAFEGLLFDLQTGFADRQEIGTRLVAEQISDMTPEARSAYADRLDEALKRPPRAPSFKGDHKDHGPERD
ncbi:periplasmic heavy metal sensor [Celeribacter litoreus]|uniref:periplasmic heavy metal sensor n=1 Tax=Celeribacter litoreus TaxID=2876714 RepID=UPI001CD01477|nr:periplasmic heavy metal sensor [Celeribacter litoreus]MCA0042995.1 periplasmic heavy metal sensor [Celeribacter litoreus]